MAPRVCLSSISTTSRLAGFAANRADRVVAHVPECERETKSHSLSRSRSATTRIVALLSRKARLEKKKGAWSRSFHASPVWQMSKRVPEIVLRICEDVGMFSDPPDDRCPAYYPPTIPSMRSLENRCSQFFHLVTGKRERTLRHLRGK